MRYGACGLMLAFCVLGNRDAAAQEFWFVPPGYGPNYYYGIDLGSGVGFGYGSGVGTPITPGMLASNSTGTATGRNPSADTFSVSQPGHATQFQPGAIKPKVAKGLPAKKLKGASQHVKQSKVTKSTK
jgi:hypothetical protein